MKDLSLNELSLINGGEVNYDVDCGMLPEVVCYGHKSSWWEKIMEGIGSVDWRSIYYEMKL